MPDQLFGPGDQLIRKRLNPLRVRAEQRGLEGKRLRVPEGVVVAARTVVPIPGLAAACFLHYGVVQCNAMHPTTGGRHAVRSA